MEDEPTIEVPLPEGTRPNPDGVVTQEIPVVAETPKMPGAPRETFVVQTLPRHLLGDPILTMDEPRADDTPLYDQINGPRPSGPKPRKRRPMQTGDKVLAGMGVASVAGVAFIYGMVTYGWGAGAMPEDEAAPKPARTVQSSPAPQEPSESPSPRRSATPEREEAVVVVAPEVYSPEPERSVVVIASPTVTEPEPTPTSEEPSASETPSEEPEPTRTSASPSEPPSASPSASETDPGILPGFSP